MGSLNRDERQALRRIQSHLQATTLETGVVVEQLGTVDVYLHPTNPDPFLNFSTPHKGVAWVRRDDLVMAFNGLKRLGRRTRLIFQDALFPSAFQQQLVMMGLTLEDERMVMVYRPLYGPFPHDETPLSSLIDTFDPDVIAQPVCTQNELAVWLRVFRAGYYQTDSPSVDPAAVLPLVEAAQNGEKQFILASYQRTPLGAARLGLRGDTAELEAVVTAPLWHGMGLETALIAVGVRTALEHGCMTIFAISPSNEFVRVYRRLGFTDLTKMLAYWQPDPDAALVSQSEE